MRKIVQSLEREVIGKRVNFVGWPEGVNKDDRIPGIRKFVSEQGFPSDSIMEIGTYEKGPYDAKTLCGASYVAFKSSDEAKRFLKKKGEDVKLIHHGTNIDVKPPKIAMQQIRNGFLRDVGKRLKASHLTKGKTVEVDWETRMVKVNGAPAFEQGKSDSSGSWKKEFTALGR